MKFRIRGSRGRARINIPFVLLGAYVLALILYALLVSYVSVPDSVAVVESLRASPYGLGSSSYSMGTSPCSFC